MNASSARLQFKTRTLANCGIVLVIFIPLVFLFTNFEWGWIADVVLMAALFYFFFYVLQNRAIGIHCPHCKNYLATNTPWVCGFCKETNREAQEFPFVYQCKHCGAEPKAYRCHHCTELIFLTEDKLERNFASCVENAPPATVDDDASRRTKEKEALAHEIEMADLAASLEEKKQRLEFGKKKTPVEEIEASFTKYYARVMGSHEFARRQKQIIDEKFKDDADLRKSAHEAIDTWLRSRV